MNILGYDIDLISCLWLALDLSIFGLLIFGLFFQGRTAKTIEIRKLNKPMPFSDSAADSEMINREMDRTMDLLMLDLSEESPINNEKEFYSRIRNHMGRYMDLDRIRLEADFEEDLID